MRHLFNSRAEIWRLTTQFDFGAETSFWDKVGHVVDPYVGVPGEMLCRFDLNFVRPGKDQPPPVVAGRRPDRVGLLFFTMVPGSVQAGDRIRTVFGPVTGMFEIRADPDPAIGYVDTHHYEVQVIEVAQAMNMRSQP